MKSGLPIEERADFLERDLELTSMMLSMLLAYLDRSGHLSLKDFEDWQHGRLKTLQEEHPKSTFRKARLSEMIAEARAILAAGAPPTPGETAP